MNSILIRGLSKGNFKLISLFVGFKEIKSENYAGKLFVKAAKNISHPQVCFS